MVALSFKDNTPAGGCGQMINREAADYNSNALWDALNDIRGGEWDAQIDSFAQIMASRSDTQFLLRVGYEVSLLLFAYNGDQYVVDWINEQASAGINVFEILMRFPNSTRPPSSTPTTTSSIALNRRPAMLSSGSIRSADTTIPSGSIRVQKMSTGSVSLFSITMLAWRLTERSMLPMSESIRTSPPA